MKIIQYRKRIERRWYVLFWQRDGHSEGTGFGFDCDEHGHVNESDLAEPARENLRQLRSGEMPGYTLVGIESRLSYYDQPTIGQCGCGHNLELAHFTNTCVCDTEYNMSGQRLVSREF